MCKVHFKAMDFLLGVCYFNGANNWPWNNSKWNYDSSFLVLVSHLYGFSRKCCQLLQSVVALKTAVPTRSSSGWGSQRWQAGLTRYITSSYISTHMMLLYFFGNCLIITTWNSLRGTPLRAAAGKDWGCGPLGCTQDLPVKNRSTKEVNTTDLADGT